MINTPLLDAVMTHIKDHPELHNQSDWFTPTDCGTAMCFAGMACHLSGMRQTLPGSRSPRVITPVGEIMSARKAAQTELGLSDRQQHILFSSSNTRPMLEQMVKDLSNSGDLHGDEDYYHDLVS
jgi:hypothetical protein